MESHSYRPLLFDAESESEKVTGLIQDQSPTIVDTFKDQIQEYVRVAELGKENPKSAEELFPEPESKANWVYYPWKNTLVKLVKEDLFKVIRTSRNKLKITEEEQRLYEKATVGVVGLSVGNAISVALAMERAIGTLVLADFDSLELSNMNRLKTSVCDLGLPKSIITARQISEIDPYLRVILYKEGITEQNIESFLSENGGIDILVEVCDGLKLKLDLRNAAKAKGIPVLMDTNDRGMFDVERFDIEPERPILHGMIEDLDLKSLNLKDMNDVLHIVQRIVPVETMSDRLKLSMSEVGKKVVSWPQLAGDVMLGSAGIAFLVRAILSKKEISSGRYFIDFEQQFRNQVDV